MFERAVALSKTALVRGVHQIFSLVRAHYSGVDLSKMAQGFPEEYSAEELDSFEDETGMPAELFADALVPKPDIGDSPGANAGEG